MGMVEKGDGRGVNQGCSEYYKCEMPQPQLLNDLGQSDCVCCHSAGERRI